MLWVASQPLYNRHLDRRTLTVEPRWARTDMGDERVRSGSRNKKHYWTWRSGGKSLTHTSQAIKFDDQKQRLAN